MFFRDLTFLLSCQNKKSTLTTLTALFRTGLFVGGGGFALIIVFLVNIRIALLLPFIRVFGTRPFFRVAGGL